jgi:hypothetical protein
MKIFVFFFAIFFAFLCTAAAQVDVAADYTVLTSDNAIDMNAVRAYWTDERLSSAHEHPLFRHGYDSELVHKANWDNAFEALKSGVLSATANQQRGTDGARRVSEMSSGGWHDTCGFSLGTSAVPPSYYSHVPFNAIGWLFGHDPKHGYNYACSASLIGQGSRQVLSTAGHCVGGDGYFNENLMFYPQRRGDSKPVGGWPVSNVKAYSCWVAQNLWECDYAFAQMNAPPGEDQLQGLGIAALLRDQGDYMACGYPAAPPFNGSLLECTRNAQIGVSSCCKEIVSKMTEGASGGPWLVGCTLDATQPTPENLTNYVNGVTSHKSSGTSLDLYSPRFTESTIALWQSAIP